MSTASTGQVTAEAAEQYERFFVPALFDQWPSRLLDLAEVAAGDHVLDVACGTGVLTRAARDRVGPAGHVEGLDLNAGMLSVAERLAPDLSWRQGSAERLPAPDDSFDRVLCQFGLMFFSDRAAALAEMARVVRPGGRVCVATWAELGESPGYAALVALLGELCGAEPARALTAPFGIGTPAILDQLMTGAFAEVDVRRLPGVARFPSLDAWVTTDVRAWTLREMLDDDQLDELRREARTRLREFCDASGRVTFAIPALVATARG